MDMGVNQTESKFKKKTESTEPNRNLINLKTKLR